MVRLESEVAVELPAEEGLHGGRAVAAQRGLLPLGRQLVESAPELAVESREVNVVLNVDNQYQMLKCYTVVQISRGEEAMQSE